MYDVMRALGYIVIERLHSSDRLGLSLFV